MRFDLRNPKDRVLPFLLFCGCVGFLIGFFLNRDSMSPFWLAIGVGLMAFFAGALFMMWADRRGL